MAITKADCSGCRDDFYNHGNHSTTSECWMFKDAQMVDRIRIGIWQNPPYPLGTVRVPSCKHEQGNCLIKREALTDEGIWRS